MSIKQKLILSNIAMVLIPVLFLFFLFGTSTNIVQRYKANPHPPKEFVNINFLLDMTASANRQNETVKMCQKIEDRGFTLQLAMDDAVIYASKDFEARKETMGNGLEKNIKVKQLVLSDEHGSEMYYETKRNNHLIKLHILSENPAPPEFSRKDLEEEAEFVRTVLIALFLLTIIIVIVTNGVLTSFISKSILTPLEILHEGTNQIKQGNLDHEVIYQKQDEFGTVCADFEEMRARLKESVLEQQRYENSRKELIAGISHDLGTPLTLIKGYVSGILDGVANTPDKVETYLRTINNTADNMKRMVDNLFIFSKLDINKVPFYFKKINLVDYFNNYCREMENDLKKKGMTLIWAAHSAAAYAMLDVMQFDRVVFNILDNSVKYKKGNQGTIAISLEEQEDDILISFRDDGQGVAQADLDNIFGIFYRTDQARGDTEKGSGLGLAIVRQIVTFHQGRVWANSDYTAGLEIMISLPKLKENDLNEKDIDCGR